MRSIKLNEVNYLRDAVISAKIDDSDLDFRNGIAVAKANITISDFCKHESHYECWGLINESYEEVYEDKINLFERNLMFMPFNKSIVRYGDNDFIVEVSCRDDNRIWTEFRHIKVIDGVPTLVNRNLGGCQKTSLENIVIAGFRNKTLYNISEGTKVTPPLMKIEEFQEEIFNAVVKIQAENSYYVDYLFFKINKEGKIISRVLSSLANRFLDEPYVSIDGLLLKRQAQLIMIRDSFDRALDSFINSKAAYSSNSEDKERIRERIK